MNSSNFKAEHFITEKKSITYIRDRKEKDTLVPSINLKTQKSCWVFFFSDILFFFVPQTFYGVKQ
jgi:hypothetical protein